VTAYEVILHPQAWHVLAATQGAGRRRLLAVLEQVAADPFRAGDLQQRDPAGRVHEVALLGEWLVTYWPDHAVREIRVVALERADDGP
jgi:hypothetical protein